MGTVIVVWLVQWGIVLAMALSSTDTSGFGQRLLASLLRPIVGIFAGGTFIFMVLGVYAARNMDYAGAASAGTSFWIELAFLVATVLAGLFRRFGGPDYTFGSAKFATYDHAERHGLLGSRGIRLGYFRQPNNTRPEPPLPLHYTGQRHIVTAAPTRAGKGVSMIVPNLLSYAGSTIVIDVKGENARITYDQRARLGRAFAVDPWGISGKPAARFNPLVMLAPDSPTLIEDAMLIAEALVLPETEGNGKHFSEQAVDLIKGFLLYLVTTPAEVKTLGRLRAILTMAPKELATVGIAMANSSHPVVRAASAMFIGKSETERQGVLSTAQRNTHFLDSPALAKSLEASDFRFADLKGQTATTVYLILPVDRLTSHSRWLRLLIAQGIAELARTPAKPSQPVLFILDEFAQLGRLPIIEDAFGLMAGLGLMLMAVVQDFAQLRRLYGEGWQTLIGNAGVIQVFGTRDLFTAQYISELIGKTTATVRSTSTSSGSSSGPQGGSSNSGSSVSLAPTQRPLLFPDELMRMDRDAQVLFIENADPVLATKITWHDDPAYRHLGVNDPGAPQLDRPVAPTAALPPARVVTPAAPAMLRGGAAARSNPTGPR